jgi:magnesium transporter
MQAEGESEPRAGFVDEEKKPIGYLFRHRFPWLLLGLLGGIGVSVIVSGYEEILKQDIRLAFFIPVIVYMSDAVGTQTETIYVRGLVRKGTKFSTYLFKETMLGLGLGAVFGAALGSFAALWLQAPAIGLTVGIAMFVSVALAPLLALAIPFLIVRDHQDPAFGAGPFATIVQDLISMLIYFLVATLIIF